MASHIQQRLALQLENQNLLYNEISEEFNLTSFLNADRLFNKKDKKRNHHDKPNHLAQTKGADDQDVEQVVEQELAQAGLEQADAEQQQQDTAAVETAEEQTQTEQTTQATEAQATEGENSAQQQEQA